MKILITINTTWNIYNFRLGLLKNIQKNGNKTIALSPADEYVNKLLEEQVEFQHISINSKGINPVEDLILIKNYISALKKIKPDVVLSYTIKPNIYASIACRFLNIPIINNVSGLGTLFIKKSLASHIAQLLYRFAFRKSSWVFFQNETDKNVLLSKKLVSPLKTSVLPGSGVNISYFKTKRTSNKGNKFLFVGRLLGDKGIREFIQAANRLSNEFSSLEFLLVGELGYNNPTAISEQELNGWLKNPGIKYLGKTDDMKSIYEQADIMVLPSYREGLSKSLIEAAAMKLPIIATNVPGCREVVDEGKNGFLCNVKNADDLYNKMKTMVSLTEQERLDMGNYSRKKAEKEFDEKIVIQRYLEKIEEITGKQK
jgi:glycosyltransferase involved in cell wall biosynthesis